MRTRAMNWRTTRLASLARRIRARLVRELRKLRGPPSYGEKLAAETAIYKDVANVNDLPGIFHYWSNKHLKPIFEEFGFSNPDEFFATYLRESASRSAAEVPRFVSIGAGNCDTEVRVAKLLQARGLRRFVIECLDMNPHMLQRGRELAASEGVSEHIQICRGDFNEWQPAHGYCAVMANQSLHHVLNLEGLFDAVKRAIGARGYFLVSDIIGRNGHRRWPEAMACVREFWKELPAAYRYNRQLQRHEERYQDWDCSRESFEGVRAQDILPLLLERFDFLLFIGFCNVIDVFIDRSFGHNFDADAPWDRDFIDRVHAFDEQALRQGTLTPTHMMGVLTAGPAGPRRCSRGIAPETSIRVPDPKWLWRRKRQQTESRRLR